MNNKIMALMAAGVAFTLASCGSLSSSQSDSVSNDSLSEDVSDSESISIEDSLSPSNSESVSEWPGFTLTSETGASNIVQDGSTYTITNSVDDTEYVASGQLLNGKILFSASSTQSCILRLADAYISNETESPIQWLASAKKIKVKSAENTTNYIYSGIEGDAGIKAITSNNNMDLGGEGVINIVASGSGADASTINVEDGGIINIDAGKNGLLGKEIILGADLVEDTFSLDITAKNGIKAELNSSNKKGTITFNNVGTVSVHDCEEYGLYADGLVSVTSGTVEINNCALGAYNIPASKLVIAEAASFYVDGVKKSAGTY